VVRPPYQGCAHLVGVAAQHWAAIDGEAASRGVDLFALGFDRLLNAVYWWAVQRVKEPDKFERTLDEHFPLPMEWILGGGPARAGGLAKDGTVTEAELEADAASFMAFASAFGVAPPKAQPKPKPDGDNVTHLRSADSA
jgi:hypothetical protein